MPNWTMNDVTFESDSSTISDIKSAFETNNPFQTLRPCPQDLLDTDNVFGGTEEEIKIREERYAANKAAWGHANWYTWRLENWGTKWDAVDFDITEQEPDRLGVKFDTAWGAPIELFIYLSSQYQDLFIEGWYTQEEEGHDTAHNYRVTGGQFHHLGDEVLIANNWEDQDLDGPDGPSDLSVRDITGSAARLPLP